MMQEHAGLEHCDSFLSIFCCITMYQYPRMLFIFQNISILALRVKCPGKFELKKVIGFYVDSD